jgi:hypothetical protein
MNYPPFFDQTPKRQGKDLGGWDDLFFLFWQNKN